MQKIKYIKERNLFEKLDSWRDKLRGLERRWKPFSMEGSALLVVDMQNFFLDESSHACVPSGGFALEQVKVLVEKYRVAGRPVIFTYFAVAEGEEDPIGEWWDDTVKDGSPESQLVEGLNPLEGELVLRKPSYDSFYETGLEEHLRELGVEKLVVTGVLSNLCCETTSRVAFIRGFDVFFVMDATAAYNEEMHLSTLLNLSHGFATPISADEI